VEFRTSVDRLLNQVGHWEQGRWSADGRAEAVHSLIQRLADLAAGAEGRPPLPVPRLSDLTLPDQLRVMADDLAAAASPETLTAAAADVEEVRRAL
jgi:hypothetical protein